MSLRSPLRLLRAVLLCALCGAIAAFAQSGDLSVLQNLPAVGVVVRGLSPDGAKLGLTDSALLEAVRGPIEEAGVKVIAPPMLERLPDAPLLEISANVSQTGRATFFYILDLQLREPVKTLRKNRALVTVPAVTWAAQKGGATAKAENLCAALGQLAQQFADEWQQARSAQ